MTGYFEMMSKYFTFTGTMTRGAYWSAFGMTMVISLIAIMVDSVVSPAHTRNDNGGLFFAVVCVAHFFPVITAGVRRIRSTGISGGWYFLAFLPLLNIVALILLLRRDKVVE